MSESRVWEANLSLPYAWTLGPTNTRFFQGLTEGKIFGTRCPCCGRVLVPARKFCARCFVDTDEWVEVSGTGTLQTFTLVNYAYMGQPATPPYICALIKLDGADTALAHYIGGVNPGNLEEVLQKIKIGMRVKACWNEERQGTIFDIKYFEPSDG